MAARGLEERPLVAGRPELRAVRVQGAAGEDLLQRLEAGQPEDGQMERHVELDQLRKRRPDAPPVSIAPMSWRSAEHVVGARSWPP